MPDFPHARLTPKPARAATFAPPGRRAARRAACLAALLVAATLLAALAPSAAQAGPATAASEPGEPASPGNGQPTPATGAPAPGPRTDAPGTLHVREDTTWNGTDGGARVRDVPTDLVVHTGATLKVLGATVSVGGRITVEPGAQLVLAALDGSAARILGRDGVGAPEASGAQAIPPDSTHGWWMDVQGALQAAAGEGGVRTELAGLRGTGLNNLYYEGGGIQVRGRASLTDVWLHDGNATLVVAQGGQANLTRVTVERTGFMALGALGPMRLRDVEVRDSRFGLIGRTLCDFDVAHTRLEAWGEPVLVNGCPLRMHDSSVVGGKANGIYLAGRALATLDNVTIRGHGGNAIMATAIPADLEPKRLEHPRLLLSNLTIGAPAIDPATTSALATGILLQGADATLTDSTVAGQKVGILAKDRSTLEMHRTRLWSNQAGLGITDSDLQEGVTLDNDFGRRSLGNANHLAIESFFHIQAAALDAFGQSVPGTGLQVHSSWDDKHPMLDAQAGANRTALGAYVAFKTGADGSPIDLRPLTYTVTNPVLGTARTGPLGLGTRLLSFQASLGDDSPSDAGPVPGAPSSPSPQRGGWPLLGAWPAWLPPWALAGLAALALAGLALRGRRSRP